MSTRSIVTAMFRSRLLLRHPSNSCRASQRAAAARLAAGSGGRPDRFRGRSRAHRRCRPPPRRPSAPAARRAPPNRVDSRRGAHRPTAHRAPQGPRWALAFRRAATARLIATTGEPVSARSAVIELLDRRPVRRAGQPAHHMRRLHRGLELIAADLAHRRWRGAAVFRPHRSGAHPMRPCPARRAARSRRSRRAARRAALRRTASARAARAPRARPAAAKRRGGRARSPSSARLRRRASVPAGSVQPSAKAA